MNDVSDKDGELERQLSHAGALLETQLKFVYMSHISLPKLSPIKLPINPSQLTY